MDPSEFEVVTITNVSQNYIAFEEPLKYYHHGAEEQVSGKWGKVEMRT